ncbi:uncharacterized protein LOC133898534 [Phragmites australis]|uniref:uncharacterized protein LOC133898534 n=1 Tax=Phragmites australis TaxID=29695 RepID=UPI002D7905E2|nr:uncharacterized protein LOC133898534 [Phragmites australis]
MTGCETCPGAQLGVGSRQPALQQPPASRGSALGRRADRRGADGRRQLPSCCSAASSTEQSAVSTVAVRRQTRPTASRGSPGRSSGCRSPPRRSGFADLGGRLSAGGAAARRSGRHPPVRALAARRGAAAAGAQLGVGRRQVPRSAAAGGAVVAQCGHEVGRASGVGEAASYGSARGELPFDGSNATELGTGALRQPVSEAAGGRAVGGSAAGGPAQGFSDSQMGSGRLGAP